jgi:hypothetical protein
LGCSLGFMGGIVMQNASRGQHFRWRVLHPALQCDQPPPPGPLPRLPGSPPQGATTYRAEPVAGGTAADPWITTLGLAP